MGIAIVGAGGVALGLSLKQNADAIREMPSLDIIRALEGAGAEIHADDPQAIQRARTRLPDVTFCSDAYPCAQGASALASFAEWDGFGTGDLGGINQALVEPVVGDPRNI